jgi:hypothetical protein
VDGGELWWLDQHEIIFGVPAKPPMAVTAEARAQAAAGEGIAGSRRVPTVRHGQGTAAWTARWETEVVGMTGLTTSAPYGPPGMRARVTVATAKARRSMPWWCASGRARPMALEARPSC